MPETYSDVPRRVSTLCRHVLANSLVEELADRTVSLNDVARVVSAMNAFQGELTQNLDIALPENFISSWWDLEIVYALALESEEAGALSPESINGALELVDALRADVREVEEVYGLQGE